MRKWDSTPRKAWRFSWTFHCRTRSNRQKVPDFYIKYRVNDLDIFTHGILRDIVRNSLNEVASTFTVEDIYGEHKAEFLRRVEALIQEKVAPVGVTVQQFGSSARRACRK